MIPLYVHTPDLVEPADPIYYLVAANGTFLVDKSALFTSVTPVPVIAGLAPCRAELRLSAPRVPRLAMERIYGFFRTVFEQWDGEAVIFVYYSAASSEFALRVPPQTLFRYRAAGRWRTERRVTYGYVPRADGFVKLGDAHSHANLPAYFSCVDDRDDTQPGLCIVMGELDRPQPDVRVSFMAHGTRFPLNARDVIEDFSEPLTPPRRWLEQVTCRTEDGYATRAGGLIFLS